MRVMVTGSRDWTDRSIIRMELARWVPLSPIIVHGACRGADQIAAEIAAGLGMAVEAHPADWKTHGRAAGPIRNDEVMRSGIAHVLAFHLNASRGTDDALARARRRGISQTIYRVDGRYPHAVRETWAPVGVPGDSPATNTAPLTEAA